MGISLYQITEDYEKVLRVMEDDEDGDGWEATLDGLDAVFEVKADNVAKMIRSLEAEAKAYKEEVDRMAQKATATNNRARRLKEYLLDNMVRIDKPKIKGTLSLSIRETLAVQEIPEFEIETIDTKFVRIIPERREIDKRAILEKYRVDNTIPESRFVETRKSLQIR